MKKHKEEIAIDILKALNDKLDIDYSGLFEQEVIDIISEQL